MQGEDQNDKKMPTRFRKQSEHLEHAIDRVLVMISERRRARTLHGTYEQPSDNIRTAAVEVINTVKMILNILESPPFDCMSEFSSLKNHLIKHITLLKHFSEQSDLSHEMESDMIDVCKGVAKIYHYIIALPPDLTELETQISEVITPEEKPRDVKVPIAIEPEAVSFSMEHGPDYVSPTQHLSMPITATNSPIEHIFPLQDVSLPNEAVPNRFEYFSLEKLCTQSNEGAVVMPHDEGSSSETEVSDTKVSDSSTSYFDYKNLQDLSIIESDAPLLTSGSGSCVIDSDSDRGIGMDSDLEQHSKDSDSVTWGMDSDSEKCPMDPDSQEHLLEAEKFQMASNLEQHLVGVEQCQLEFDSLKHHMDPDSEKSLADSDSEKYVMASDNERPRIDSDSKKYPMASASVKHLLKAEKCQMASDSIKRFMESEKKIMETEQHWLISASERYVMDSYMERDAIDSDSASEIYLMGEGKHQKIRSERHIMDSDFEPCRMDSDSKRYELASASVKCLMNANTVQLNTETERHYVDSWSVRHTMDLDSESLDMSSDLVNPIIKAENCQRASDLERFWMGLGYESERYVTGSERQQLNFDCSRCWYSSRKYQHRSSRLQGSSGRCQEGLQKHWGKFERHQIDSDSEKHGTDFENERYQNEFESERHIHMMEMEQSLLHSENEILQMDEEREKYLIKSDGEKEHKIVPDNERHDLDSEGEAQRLGARRKANRPQGFWRPIFLSPPHSQRKETEERHSVQQIDNKVSRIQLVRYPSDDKTVRFKEMSPTLSDKQDSQQKLMGKHSHNIFSNPNTFMDKKHHRNASHKISVCKSCYTDYRYQQRFQSSRCQISPIHFLNPQGYTSEFLVPVYHPTSMSPWFAVCPKTHRNNTYTLDTGALICSKCFVQINNFSFHKCLINSDDDSDSDCPLHLQVPLDSKHSLSSRSSRHHKTSRNSPLSRSLDPEQPVGIRCPFHWEDYKYSLGSTSFLHSESCSALQNLMGSTVTHTFPMNPQNNISHHRTPGPGNVIHTSSVAGLESDGKFKFTAKFENEANPDETKLVNTGNLKDKAKDKPLFKDDANHEDETDSEDEKEPEDETDPEDESNTKDRKDPKDKSDPDNTDPKDSNAENDADTSNEPDPSGDADSTSGADSTSDGDSNSGTESNSEPDSNIGNATNNDANSKCNTDFEENKHANNSKNVFVLDIDVYQECTADSNNDSNPNYTSGFQNGAGPDCTSGSCKGAGFSIGSSSIIGLNNELGPNNAPSPNINESGLQNNGSGPQNIRLHPFSPGFSSSVSGPNINGLRPNNIPVLNNNNPGLNNNSPGPNNNSSGLEKHPDSSYNARLSNATSYNIAFSPNKDANSIYETKSISAAGHNYVTSSNLEYVPGFTHAVGANFVDNPNYIARNSYAASPSSTSSTVNVTDTSYTTIFTSAISPTYTNCASDTNHEPGFTQIIGSKFVINPNYHILYTYHNSSTSNASNLSETKLEINPSSSIPNIVYSNSSVFVAGTNYISTPEKLTTSKFSNPPKLDRSYTIFDDYKFGACFKDYPGPMDSVSFKHTTEFKDVLDAKESGFLKDFSEVQNPIVIKEIASLNFHSNSNIPLPSFDIIVEAEPPDVVKFVMVSGAVNQFFKWKTCFLGICSLRYSQIISYPKILAT
ncbi:uncharacterized protein LOC122435691 isoform X2 [Cervus canadensis]|uniref:uncharacterized protein LOC122435691 isoform X2 n=1 Tax=Cervus canadensis TaxID=1574408 RepID=UPI001CA33393|nr:uncharacterized protein LOC122435691 isoform X2 [Cervus canadensis]